MIANFKTASGTIVPAISAEQMRQVDRIAVKETGPNLFQMMENAGRNMAIHIMVMKACDQHSTIVVLAGTGGNGGSGICAARHLANHGFAVFLALTHPDRLGDVALIQQNMYQFSGGQEWPLHELLLPDSIVDVIIGQALDSKPRDRALEFIEWANEQHCPIVSLDIPSGVHATTGDTPGKTIEPAQTITLALPKTGLLPERTGELFLADIGIPQSVYKSIGLHMEQPFSGSYIVPIRPA